MGKLAFGYSRTRARVGLTPAASGPPTTPLAGYVLWLDGADDATKTFSGSTVLTWTDKSASAYVFTSHASPQATTLNGLPAIAFVAASSQYFDKTGAVAISGSTDFTMFAVAKVSATNIVSSIFALDGNNATSGDNQIRCLINNNNSHSLMTNSTTTRISMVGSVAWGTSNPHIIVFRRNGTAMDQRTDTSADGSGTLSSTDGTPTQMLVGKISTTPQYMGGTIAEIVVYNDNLSDGDRDTMVTYLKNKWGTP